jgi:hypothetical protein
LSLFIIIQQGTTVQYKFSFRTLQASSGCVTLISREHFRGGGSSEVGHLKFSRRVLTRHRVIFVRERASSTKEAYANGSILVEYGFADFVDQPKRRRVN